MEFAQTFEIIVIGGGPAGYHFANLCGKKGVSIALFEERALGGTCLNEGCIPTKSFLKSAKIVDSIKHSEEFGVAVKRRYEFGPIVGTHTGNGAVAVLFKIKGE